MCLKHLKAVIPWMKDHHPLSRPSMIWFLRVRLAWFLPFNLHLSSMRQSLLAFKQLPPMGSFHWLLLQKASLPERKHHWCFSMKSVNSSTNRPKIWSQLPSNCQTSPWYDSNSLDKPSCISTIPNSIANITDFCTGRHWIVDHTLHHLGCVDHLDSRDYPKTFAACKLLKKGGQNPQESKSM